MSELTESLKRNGGESFDSSFFPKTASRGEMDLEAMLQTQSIPGESLTNSPDARMPFENPPEYTEVQEFIEDTFIKLTDEEILPDVLQALRSKIPVETLAHKYLMGALQQGQITPDLLLTSIEPLIYILISLGTYANIDVVLYPEGMDEDADEQNQVTADLFRSTAKDMDQVTDETGDGRITVEDLEKPAVIPKSLLSKSKTAVANVTGGTA